MGILVYGGFSISNYLQGNLGPRRNDCFVRARKILKIRQT